MFLPSHFTDDLICMQAKCSNKDDVKTLPSGLLGLGFANILGKL